MNKQKQFYISKGSQKSKNSKLKCSLKTTLQEGINPTRRPTWFLFQKKNEKKTLQFEKTFTKLAIYNQCSLCKPRRSCTYGLSNQRSNILYVRKQYHLNAKLFGCTQTTSSFKHTKIASEMKWPALNFISKSR